MRNLSLSKDEETFGWPDSRLDVNRNLNYRHSRVECRVNMMKGLEGFPGIFALIIEKRELYIRNQSVKQRWERDPINHSHSFAITIFLSLHLKTSFLEIDKLASLSSPHPRKSRDCFICDCANIPFCHR